MRIGIAGCPGTGKSILGQKLAEEMSLPFLPSKVITGEILQRDGYDYASGKQVEKFLATDERQAEILKRTIEQQSIEAFVTDRTGIDLAAYAIMEMHDPAKVQKYVEECAELCKSYTHIIFCPWADREILNNQKRTLDPWYQFTVHSVQLGIMEKFGIKPLVMHHSEIEDRIEVIKHFFDICSLGKGVNSATVEEQT